MNTTDNLYILKSFGSEGKEIIKFGYSSVIENRIQSYYSHNPYIELIGTYYREEGKEFELFVHSKIQAELRNEWYTVDKLEEIKDLIKNGVIDVPVKNLPNVVHPYGFEQTVKTLKEIEAKDLRSLDDIAFRETAYLKYPFLEEAITKLDFKGIEEENYIQTNIKRKLACMLDVNQETKIFKLLKLYSDISAGNFIPSKILKERFTQIYKQLDMDKKAKGIDINNFFNCKLLTKRINGKNTDGYIIYTPKQFIN